MRKLVHVIGAGLAGLAAAVQLQRRGAQVVLYEAAEQAGGRCRTYYDRALAATVDSGNHLVLSGQQATLNYVRAIGSAEDLVGPTQPEYPFVDLATNQRWAVRMSQGRLPAWIFEAGARVPDTQWTDYLSVVPLLLAKPGRNVAQTMRSNGPLWDRMLRPLLLAMTNVDPRHATAELAGAALRDTFVTGGPASRALVARNGLGSAFVDPALRLLQHGGAAIRLGARIDGLEFSDGDDGRRVASLRLNAEERIEIGANEAVVLAVTPDVAQSLVPGMQAPRRFSAIVTAHFAVEPPLGHPPLMGLVNATANWLVASDGRLSVTVYDAARLTDMPRDDLARKLWADVAQVTGLSADLPLKWQLIVEPRATFAAQPDEEMRRPATRTRWNNLMLAGDWTATGLPPGIEGAIRSGQKAADTLLNEPMERR
ncbi:hydroxysqualene dehydroxylase HpnE [Paraburkholderia phymatum]|uniref:Squalene-associated FAD-dependent desaturase n=1 Tax=Paraburkholderia phymatum (strain DSM 17167 / CIP 108236 / LMG 21445 / STM815) TaxID=391038 RepID=B2JPR8_PARP8|nr:hydroxysqualene dehydroxylase HpnE [Paraburkholderia phymatum]ACC73259.1 squalene-associated FAD-dependent desaturase [Paraburkholderia phymatum STM815]